MNAEKELRPDVKALVMAAIRKINENDGQHLHHADCIHNLSPEQQVTVRGRTVEWWLKMIGPLPEQITPDQWETTPLDIPRDQQ